MTERCLATSSSPCRWIALSIAARAQFTGIYTFNGNYDGCCAYYADLLAQDTNGNLAGTMPVGAWAAPYGSWFNYLPGAAAPSIHELQSSTQAEHPYSGFTLGIDGNLYGAGTHIGGSSYGALFMINNGVMTTLYKFAGGSGGSFPYAPPVQAPDGNLYGVTYDYAGTGYVYQYVMAAGALGWIHALPAGSRAPLVMANDGNLYGTIPYGGFTINGVGPSNNNCGAVFQVTLSGVVTGIYNINGTSSNNSGWGDGCHPWGAVMQAADGYLYATASSAGAYAGGTVYKVALNGTGFTVIHNFQANDGITPTGGLVQGSDGYLYGLTTDKGYILQIYMQGGGPVFKTGRHPVQGRHDRRELRAHVHFLWQQLQRQPGIGCRAIRHSRSSYQRNHLWTYNGRRIRSLREFFRDVRRWG